MVALVVAYLAVRFLTRYFSTRTLTTFAIYCLVVGVLGPAGTALVPQWY